MAGAGMGGHPANDIGGGGCGWGPRPKEPVAKVRGWIEQSLHVFRDLAKDPATGVRMTPALSVGDRIETGAMPPGLELIPDVRPADPADVPGGFRAGFHATFAAEIGPYQVDDPAIGGLAVKSKRARYGRWPRPLRRRP
ncbi:D-amino acid oxidase [Mycobacterium tuberculosis CAS/NITR204]|uniref:D-amino acid oxidase n=1 Tax=Mycobacterium tuberculosis CAS/NITR204 TaxID=1310114 RepID=R4MEG1_MYCTX|nr:D-amino acid oxidase [Mycobacterium tuberculosis CAS/NITR204]